MLNDTHIINEIKKNIVRMAYYSKASHVASCLSCVDIIYTLYFKIMHIDVTNPQMLDRDKFLLSKGHASAALYATLAEKGFLNKDILDKYYIDNGILPGHPDMTVVEGIETSSGSLGHGLSIGVGMAIANRQSKNKGRIFVLLGDGECNEGSIWEATMLASSLELSNITAIVDYNKLQGFGRTNEVVNRSNIANRWKSFGWEVIETDGNDVEKLEKAFNAEQTKPKVIIAHTIKGNGVSFMADKLEWHYKSPSDEQYVQAIQELSSDIK